MSRKLIKYIGLLFLNIIIGTGIFSCSSNYSGVSGSQDSLWILPAEKNQQQLILNELDRAILNYDTTIFLIQSFVLESPSNHDQEIDSIWMESVRHFHLLLQLSVDNPAELHEFGIAYANYLDAANYVLFCYQRMQEYNSEDSTELWSSRSERILSFARKELTRMRELFPEVKNSLSAGIPQSTIDLDQSIYNEIQTRAKILEIIDSVSVLIYSCENYYSICILGPVNESRPPKSFLLTFSSILISSEYTNLINSLEDWSNWPGMNEQKFRSFLDDFSNYLRVYSRITNFYGENYYRSKPLAVPDELQSNYNQALNKFTHSQNELREWVFEVR